MKHLIYFVFFLGLAPSVVAQELDSLQISKVGMDSLTKAIPNPKKLETNPPLKIVPKYATYRSLILPGLGQAYIKQYWTIPIIYAGFGGLGYAIHWNNVRYKIYRNAWAEYIQQVADKKTPNVSVTVGSFTRENVDEQFLRLNTANFRRQRDLSIIGCLALYALQLVEANVSAHLKTFDNTDDISLRFKPGVQTDRISTPMGVTAVLTFK